MPAKWHKYSYSAQRDERRYFLSILSLILLLTVLFTIIHTFLFTMYRIESETMYPTLTNGDFVASTPLYAQYTDKDEKFSPLVYPRRGDLAVIASPHENTTALPITVLNSVIAFLTFQRLTLFSSPETRFNLPLIRRIIGFPGDKIYMENYVIHIKTPAAEHFLTEFEVIEDQYDINISELPPSWSSSLPFSGSFAEITLQEDQFFVLCDNRSTSSDSRLWGPISAQQIEAKVLFRYWPFKSFGAL